MSLSKKNNSWNPDPNHNPAFFDRQKKKLFNYFHRYAVCPTTGIRLRTSEDWAASTDAESGMERERPKFAMVGLNLPISSNLFQWLNSQQWNCWNDLKRGPKKMQWLLGWVFAHRQRNNRMEPMNQLLTIEQNINIQQNRTIEYPIIQPNIQQNPWNILNINLILSEWHQCCNFRKDLKRAQE